MKKIIVVIGGRGQGKSTFSNMLNEKMGNTIGMVETSNKVSRDVATMFGITQQEALSLKDDGEVRLYNKHGLVSTISVRRIMQVAMMEQVSDFVGGKFLYVVNTIEEVNKLTNNIKIISGARLVQEVGAYKSMLDNVIVVRVKRKVDETDDNNHISERQFDLIDHDVLIETKSLEELNVEVDKFIVDVLKMPF